VIVRAGRAPINTPSQSEHNQIGSLQGCFVGDMEDCGAGCLIVFWAEVFGVVVPWLMAPGAQ